MTTLPPYHSISALQKWEECPKAYHYRYIAKPDVGLVEDDADHLKIGRAVHSAFEKAYQVMLDEKLSGTLVQALDASLDQLRSAWFEAGLGENSEGLQAAVEAVTKTLTERSTSWEKILGIEHEFRFHMPSGAGFLGYADLIEQVGPEDIEILDWKITYKPKSADEVFRSFQLNSYGWAVRQLWPWAKNIWVGENYPMVGQAVRVKLDDNHMDYAVARFEANAEALETEHLWEPVIGRHCEWCPFRSICPALGGIPADQLTF